ncbi:VOC family protein [Halobaculum sp. D14]|uniref:VOC family protein n=1 Tax=Halobaculum sp. D14 TaxID=3421642 RepID=UPI003EBE953C
MTESSTAAVPDAARVGRVALRVENLDRQVSFYESVVGLAVLERRDDRAVLGAGGDPLVVLTAAPDAPERGRDETGLFHAAFLFPSRGALADALGRVEAEWELTGASDHRVSEALYLRDPEGNGVELYRDRPRREWPETDDGRVEMDTLPLDLDSLRTDAAGESAAPPGTTVGHVHLEVSSIDASRAFYADALGLRVRQAFGPSALFLAADGYHHHVGLNTWNGRTAPATGRGLDWFEFVLPDGDAVVAARNRFEAADVAAVRERGDAVAVDDPDGITLLLRAATDDERGR